MPRGAARADDVRMNQSTYEQVLPNGFTQAAVAERPTAGALMRTGRLLARSTAEEQVRVAVLKAEDLPEVTAMLGRCSRATLYKRFHGFTDGVAHASFTIDDAAQDAYGAWSGGACVGMASLAITQEGHGEIGVLVEDAWQRRGAGSALVAALVERAQQLGLPGLIADVLADNYFVLPLLARVGAISTTFAYSGYRVRVGLGVPVTAGAVRADVPVWN
jgi:RimJ/RimL family protein N-acetyltransferase